MKMFYLFFIFFSVTLTLGLLQPQPVQCQNESSIGNFYGNFFTGSSAKIAARNTLTTKYQTLLADLNVDCYPLVRKLSASASNSAFQNRFQFLPLIISKNTYPKRRVDSFKVVNIKATAYYGPTKHQDGKYFNKTFQKEVAVNGAGKITAYGTKPRIGIVATDPEFFPRGTLFLATDPLDGEKKFFIAEDTGGGIQGYHLDFFVGWGKTGYERVKKFQRAGNRMTVKVIQRAG